MSGKTTRKRAARGRPLNVAEIVAIDAPRGGRLTPAGNYSIIPTREVDAFEPPKPGRPPKPKVIGTSTKKRAAKGGKK